MGDIVRTLALMGAALIGLAGCDRISHPEHSIRVHTGVLDGIKVYAQDGYLSVDGVWTIEGDDKIAAPINISTIQCYRDDAYCVVQRTEIMTVTGSPVMVSREDMYSLTQWTANEVRANTDDGCRMNEIRIDIPGNAVSEVTSNLPGGSCNGVNSFSVDKPRIARMISGTELEEQKKRGL